MKKVLTIALLLGLWSVQGQTVIRNGGVDSVAISEVRGITGTLGYLEYLDEWRFGVNTNLLFEGIHDQIATTQISLGNRVGDYNLFLNGSIGYAEGPSLGNNSALIGASIRWDEGEYYEDYYLFKLGLGLELSINALVGGMDMLMPSIDAHLSARMWEAVMVDFTFGVGNVYSTNSTFSIFRFGIGVNVGGGIF
jgi:hypothetical protein